MSLIGPHADMREVNRLIAADHIPLRQRAATALRSARDYVMDIVNALPIPEAVMREEAPILRRQHPTKTDIQRMRENAQNDLDDVLR